MILQVLLRLQHQAVRRRVLLVAALLTAAAGRSVHNVDLLVRNVKKANGVARLASPAAASVDDLSVHHNTTADSRTERYFLSGNAEGTDGHHVLLALAGTHPALRSASGVRIVVENGLLMNPLSNGPPSRPSGP